MHDILNQIIGTTNLPFITAFLLGVLVSISPCTIAANVMALSLITSDKETDATSKGFIYITGRCVAYILLGAFLYFFIDGLELAQWLQKYIGMIIGPIFILLGLLFARIIHLHGLDDVCINYLSKAKITDKKMGAFAIGIILAFAFCPYSGTIYFGALVPLMFGAKEGLFLPIIFAIGCAIPIFPIVYIVSKGSDYLAHIQAKYENSINLTQKAIGVFFIISGCLFVYEYYIE